MGDETNSGEEASPTDDDEDDIEEIMCENTTPIGVHTATSVPRRLFWDDVPKPKTTADSKSSTVEPNDSVDVAKMRNIKVMVVKEYQKQNNREISLHIGTRIKQLLPANKDGFSFGIKRTSTKQKKKGFYPADCVSLC